MRDSNKPKQGLGIPIKPLSHRPVHNDQGSLSEWLDDVVDNEGAHLSQDQEINASTTHADIGGAKGSGVGLQEADAYELRNPLGVDRPAQTKKKVRLSSKTKGPSPARKKLREALKQSKPSVAAEAGKKTDKPSKILDSVAENLPDKDAAILGSLNNLAERLEQLGQQITTTQNANKTDEAPLAELPTADEGLSHSTTDSVKDKAVDKRNLDKVLQPFGSRLDDLAQKIEMLSRQGAPALSAPQNSITPNFSGQANPAPYAYTEQVPHDISDGLADVRRQIRQLNQRSEGGLNAESLKERLNQLDLFQHNLARVTEAVSHLCQRDMPLDLAPLQAQIADLRQHLERGHGGESLVMLEQRLDKLERLLDPLNDRLADMQQHVAKGSPEEYYRLEQMILELSSMFAPVDQRFETLEQSFGQNQQTFMNNFGHLKQTLSSNTQRFADLEAQLTGLNSRLNKPLPADPKMVKGFHEKLDDLQNSVNAADQRLSVLGSFEQSLRDMVGLLERSTSVANDVAEKVAHQVIDSHKQSEAERTQDITRPINKVAASINELREDVQENDRQAKDHFKQVIVSLGEVNNQIVEARTAQEEYEAFERTRIEAEDNHVNLGSVNVEPAQSGINKADFEITAPSSRKVRKHKVKKRSLVDRLMGKSHAEHEGSLDADIVREAKMRADHASQTMADAQNNKSGEKKVRRGGKKSTSPLTRLVLYLMFLGLVGWLFVTQFGIDTQKLVRNLVVLTQIIINETPSPDSVSNVLPNQRDVTTARLEKADKPLAVARAIDQAITRDYGQTSGVQTVALVQPETNTNSHDVTLPAVVREDVETTAALSASPMMFPLPRREMQSASLINPASDVIVVPDLPAISLHVLTDKLRTALKNRDPNAMVEIGRRYAEGLHTAANWNKALVWFKIAAENQLPIGLYEYAKALEYKAASKQDIEKAYTYYRKAADAGNIEAIQALGMGYAKGLFSEKSTVEAAKWFKKAADHGLLDGQFNYAILLSRGVGVPHDTVEAYKWFGLAEQAGDREARQRKNTLATTMSAEDIREAEMRIAAWQMADRNTVANHLIAPPGGW